MGNRHNLTAYLATLAAIVVLAVTAAAVCLFASVNSEVNLARIIGALAFISAAISGLTGVIGTFKASSSGMATQNVEHAENVTSNTDKEPSK